MTTKSQKAFEAHYLGYHNILSEDFSKTNGLYNLSYLHRDYEKWQAAESYGRKQALEELKAAFLKFENNKFAQLEMVKELIK